MREALALFARIKHRVNHRIHHLAHTGEHAAHYAYLGLVYFESHGLYGKAAGVMLVCLACTDLFKAD